MIFDSPLAHALRLSLSLSHSYQIYTDMFLTTCVSLCLCLYLLPLPLPSSLSLPRSLSLSLRISIYLSPPSFHCLVFLLAYWNNDLFCLPPLCDALPSRFRAKPFFLSRFHEAFDSMVKYNRTLYNDACTTCKHTPCTNIFIQEMYHQTGVGYSIRIQCQNINFCRIRYMSESNVI